MSYRAYWGRWTDRPTNSGQLDRETHKGQMPRQPHKQQTNGHKAPQIMDRHTNKQHDCIATLRGRKDSQPHVESTIARAVTHNHFQWLLYLNSLYTQTLRNRKERIKYHANKKS